jgi:hypothetical protein
MKRILNLRRHHYLAKFSIFLIMVALIVVMVGCRPVILYSLTMAANPAVGGTATDLTGASPYIAGTVVDIEAVANPGYRFVNWSGDVVEVDDVDAATTYVTMNAPYSITANFAPFAGGNGTKGDPYQIADWYQLDNVRNYLDSYFILVNDLDSTTPGYSDLASPTAHGGKGWQPIGGSIDASCNPVDPFTGSFAGQGHEISDLFINRPNENGVGLFGVATGAILNVGVVDADVTGGWGVGIVGGSRVMSRCYSSGRVSGLTGVGGLTGGNIGSISDSYSTASVSGGSGVSSCIAGVGGLVGENEGTISDCYATGSVTGGADYTGGLLGWNCVGTVDSSYATGSVTGSGDVGGLVGRNDDTVSDSFWDTTTSGLPTSDGGTGRTTAQMKDFDTFDGAGWDIIAVGCPGPCTPAFIWNICVDAYPFLCW